MVVKFERRTVVDGLTAAGWFPGREVDYSSWIGVLEREGFVLSQVALRVWAELGGLKVVRQGGDRPSSLRFDPVDAASGVVSEARRLGEDYGENLSPIGLWSSQYRCYIAESGWVMAVGPGWDWKLGDDLEEALDLVVTGDREISLIKITKPGAPPFPSPKDP